MLARVAALVVFAAALACAATGSRGWVRADASEPSDPEQMARDRAECVSSYGIPSATGDGPRPTSADRRRLAECMRTRGWVPAR